MKKMILLAVAVAGVFTLATAANAEPLYSPKAKALADSLKKVPAVTSDVNLALERPAGNAKAWELARSLRSVPSTGPSLDLAHAPRPTMSPKDPRFEAALRANAVTAAEVQIAPLK
jgi:hypothetical protein